MCAVDHERRALHSERFRHEIRDRFAEWLVRRALDDGTQHVDRERIAPFASRRVEQRNTREAAHFFSEVDLHVVEPVGDLRLVIRPVGLLRELVAEARGVRQKLSNGDRRCRAVREFRLEVRQPLVTGSSSESFLRSTSASAATVTIGFETEDRRNSASTRIGL